MSGDVAWRHIAGSVGIQLRPGRPLTGQPHLLLQAANVGDSAAFVSEVRLGAEVQPLTADHRLTNPLERERLAAMGIHLGSDRTRLYGLNLARCLGDR